MTPQEKDAEEFAKLILESFPKDSNLLYAIEFNLKQAYLFGHTRGVERAAEVAINYKGKLHTPWIAMAIRKTVGRAK